MPSNIGRVLARLSHVGASPVHAAAYRWTPASPPANQEWPWLGAAHASP